MEEDQSTYSSIASSSSSSCKAEWKTKVTIIGQTIHRGNIVCYPKLPFILESGSEFRKFCYALVESSWFSSTILVVILINTVFIGIQTSEEIVARSEWYLTLMDQLFLSVYIIELSLKLNAWRFLYFKTYWNVFDFTIVATSGVDFLIPLINQNIAIFDTEAFNALRVFRALKALKALRVIRTIRFMKNLQVIVTTVLQSIPALGSIIIIISLVLYIFAVIGRGLYGGVDPDRFGNIAQACFTLFQLMTLDDWFVMYSNIRDNHPEHQHILAYLLLFILIETFIFINLFVAVIVDNLARAQAAANYSRNRDNSTEHVQPLGEWEHSDEVVRKQNVSSIRGPADSNQNTLYKEEGLTPRETRETELMNEYLLLLHSLEHHLSIERSHQRTLYKLVDLADFSKT
ncbi:cation channel sperm-associated protein 1-like [Halichondria panicea]|uniref:cation channel sperm-associated protein 1-like n=1 Tax=Halichondria panicea TaxID=6063 RepID=UPI00312B6499